MSGVWNIKFLEGDRIILYLARLQSERDVMSTHHAWRKRVSVVFLSGPSGRELLDLKPVCAAIAIRQVNKWSLAFETTGELRFLRERACISVVRMALDM